MFTELWWKMEDAGVWTGKLPNRRTVHCWLNLCLHDYGKLRYNLSRAYGNRFPKRKGGFVLWY